MPAPVITVQPVAQNADLGTGASIHIVATGTPTPTYQWYLNGVAIGGATSATYTIASLSQANCGQYYCIASNTGGNTQSITVPIFMNAYYGAVAGSGGSPVDGNWNTVANWYSYKGFSTSNSTIPPVALGRLPNALTDYVQIILGTVSTGPTSGYTGIIEFKSDIYSDGIISSGTYSGTVLITSGRITGGTFSGAVTNTSGGQIYGGTFTGSVTASKTSNGSIGGSGIINWDLPYMHGGTFNCPVSLNGAIVDGGTFNGIITASLIQPRSQAGPNLMEQNYGDAPAPNWFFGGTYSPPGTLTLTWSGNQPHVSGFVSDPGFAAGGGTFSPVYTYVGFSDILGAGLL